jgi:hypothetical protein
MASNNRQTATTNRKETTMKAKDTKYNGWKNYATWNVALWINNDEPLYRAAVDYVRRAKHPNKGGLYRLFIESIGLDHSKTPDGINWISDKLGYKELNNMLRELA